MTNLPFTDAASRDAWNGAAEAWEVFVESGADYYRWHVHGPALLDACGEVRDRHVLDLGCGQGYFSRELTRRGARVVGIDLSDQLIRIAREHEDREPLDIEYRVLNAADLNSCLDANSFDFVTACMAIQDMTDVPAVIRGAFDVLTKSGRMVFSVPHPGTDTRFRQWERDADGRKIALKIDGYFESGQTICHWNMPRLLYHWDTPCWRYTLSEWSEMIASAGFFVRGLYEPRPTEEQIRMFPDLEDCGRLPYFLIFDLCKAPG